jgi:hypothetical protein
METGPGDGQIRGACPLDCPDTCCWIVTVQNGEPVALRGDPAHPYTRRVANVRGAFFAIADVSDRIRPGVVASTKGRWPGDSKQGATINATVDVRDSDMGGGAVYHDNRVCVDRILPDLKVKAI